MIRMGLEPNNVAYTSVFSKSDVDRTIYPPNEISSKDQIDLKGMTMAKCRQKSYASIPR